eukprot:COSAG02_NODE_1807_length_10865_cov_25.450585_7_plen_695_part_00
MSGGAYNYTKPPVAVPTETSVAVSECGQHLREYGAYLVWGLSDDDSVVAMQLLPAAVVFILAVLDLQFRKPALSPLREFRACQQPITLILPSLVWRTMNWCTCCAWIVVELWGAGVDLPATVFQMYCAGDCSVGDVPGRDCSPGVPPRADDLGPLASDELGPNHPINIQDLRTLLLPIAVAAPMLVFVNGLLCVWAWQYYAGVHNLYRSLFNHGPEWFKTVATPDCYLSELSGMELILGAADTMLVNIPVCWMASRLYDLGLGLGMFGHINLAMSIVTYILNTWLFADKSPIVDGYRWNNGGSPNFCPTSSSGLAEFLVWLLFFPVAWIAMGFTALPVLQLLRTGFDPRTMRLNWCCVPRYHHHRTRGFGQNDAVAVLLNRERFPWFQQKAWKIWLTAEQRRALLPSLDRNVGNESLFPLMVEYEAQQRRAQMEAARSASSAAARSVAAGMSQVMVLSMPTTIYQPCDNVTASDAAVRCEDPIKQREGASHEDVVSLDNDDNGVQIALCSICYEEVEPGSRVFAMQCSHVQHYDCMKLWIVRKPECPECRQRLPLPNVAATTAQLNLRSPAMDMVTPSPHPGTQEQEQREDEMTATQRRAMARRERIRANQTERMQIIQQGRWQSDPEREQTANVVESAVESEERSPVALGADIGRNEVSVNPLTSSPSSFAAGMNADDEAAAGIVEDTVIEDL